MEQLRDFVLENRAAVQNLQFRTSLFKSCVRLESPDEQQPLVSRRTCVAGAAKLTLRFQRDPDIELPADFKSLKVRRRDTDDRKRDVLEGHGLTDRIGTAAETSFPQRVADDRHRGSAGPIVFRQNRTASDDPDTQVGEVVTRNVLSVEALHRFSFDERMKKRIREGKNAGTRLRMCSEILQRLVRKRIAGRAVAA